MQTQYYYCYRYLTLQAGRLDIWLGLGLLHTPDHPFSSTTQLRSTPYMSRSHECKAKQILLHHNRNKAISLVNKISIGNSEMINVKVEDFRTGKLTLAMMKL
ncbi:hypothetical protein PoB_004151400 [Plakobranchus ocellatus]|uniref:Uncharacterized protein n=1 Tax=Plakobranchus ocellatus TaxID=259542 RepID=A0AAV4B8J1_9GAST|nr:hypothetical protein PoB_004151400 [Plakobranchus ocellatus]